MRRRVFDLASSDSAARGRRLSATSHGWRSGSSESRRTHEKSGYADTAQQGPPRMRLRVAKLWRRSGTASSAAMPAVDFTQSRVDPERFNAGLLPSVDRVQDPLDAQRSHLVFGDLSKTITDSTDGTSAPALSGRYVRLWRRRSASASPCTGSRPPIGAGR